MVSGTHALQTQRLRWIACKVAHGVHCSEVCWADNHMSIVITGFVHAHGMQEELEKELAAKAASEERLRHTLDLRDAEIRQLKVVAHTHAPV